MGDSGRPLLNLVARASQEKENGGPHVRVSGKRLTAVVAQLSPSVAVREPQPVTVLSFRPLSFIPPPSALLRSSSRYSLSLPSLKA